jgi:streptomycin 6-kinase
MFHIPARFINEMFVYHGEEGRAWIDELPRILADCEKRWDVKIGPPFSNLSFHYVAPAVCSDGTQVIIKAQSPTDEFVCETEALRIFAGRGMVKLLACDADDHVLMLERLYPGNVLSNMEDDEKAISAAVSVMRQLWRPVPAGHSFPSVQDWGQGFVRLRERYHGGNGPFPAALLDEAERLFAELSASMAEPVLLHGDLHQENILASEREPWLGIDPKGLIGEPAYETGPLLRNFFPQLWQHPQPGRVLARRIDQMSEELELDRARIRGWGIAQAILSVWWSVEDSGRIEDGADVLTCAQLMAAHA